MNNKGIIIGCIICIISLCIGLGVGLTINSQKSHEKCRTLDSEETKNAKSSEDKLNRKEQKVNNEETNFKCEVNADEFETESMQTQMELTSYNDFFFGVEIACGTDCQRTIHIYNKSTGEKIVSGNNSTLAIVSNKVYSCESKIIEYDEKGNKKENNSIDKCIKLDFEKEKETLYFYGTKDNQLVLYDYKNNKTAVLQEKISKEADFEMAILEPYRNEDYNLMIEYAYKDNYGYCTAIGYNTDKNEVKEFTTDCWGKLKDE